MGNTPCNCANWSRKDKDVSFIITTSSPTNQVKLIQRNVRQFLTRTKMSKSDASQQSCPGIEILDTEVEARVNPIIAETEQRLGIFVTNSKNIKENETRAILYPDNSIYIGTFDKNWKKQGISSIYLTNDCKYIGDFKDDQMHGNGRIIYSDGSYYQGHFENGLPNGYGVYGNNDGYIYKGNWKREVKQGHGEESYKDGETYIGEFMDDFKHGKGKLQWSCGRLYEGDFCNNEMHGIGRMIWPDNKISIGHWINNRLEGVNIFYWYDTRRYVGNYSNFKKVGFGIFWWNKLKTYEGMWLNGKQHGNGFIREGEIGSSSSCTITLCEWRYGHQIKKFEESSPQYTIIMNELLSLSQEMTNFCKQFGIKGIHDENFYEKIIHYKIYANINA